MNWNVLIQWGYILLYLVEQFLKIWTKSKSYVLSSLMKFVTKGFDLL